MIDAKFEYGTEVRVIKNIRNDGSFPGCKKGDLLVRRGSVGYVQQAGLFLQEQVIYQVHFLQRGLTVGCRETELVGTEQQWFSNRFEYGDKARLTLRLGSQGNILAEAGEVVDILAVDRRSPESPSYRIQYHDLDVMVPERALSAIEEVAYVE
ncbi:MULTISPECIES: nitrogen fixation protein NifZ [Aliagarivorans]|uniref:nitrogen fixation protein NifZ n=1 Tax=Aliagarivorans TaxID=882379 RepID=UPI00040FCED6|nr:MULTISPECIES: nitrogen fixation protein NifZ [Aliagarivorans]